MRGGEVVVRNSDLFSEWSDMIVLPCSRSGSISWRVEEQITKFGIPGPYRGADRAAELGHIEVHDLGVDHPVTRYVCWAVTVFRTYCTLGALRTVGREVALVAETKSDVQVIASPLLGTGAGNVDPEKSATAIVEGFQSAEVKGITLRLHVLDASLADRIQHILDFGSVEEVLRVPPGLVINGPDFAECVEALLDAFDEFGLCYMVKIGLDEDLYEIVADGPLKKMVFELLLWAEREGKLTQVLQSAIDEVPGNPKLKALIQRLS
jgi:Effector-associated domain 1